MYWFTFSFSKSEPLSIKCVHPVWLFIENYWISGCLRLLKMDHYGSVLLECGALIDSSFAFKVHAEIQQELPEWMTFRAGAGHFSCSPEGEAQSIHPISESPSQDKHTPSTVALTLRGDLESQSDPNMQVLGFIHWENMQALHRKTLSPDRSGVEAQWLVGCEMSCFSSLVLWLNTCLWSQSSLSCTFEFTADWLKSEDLRPKCRVLQTLYTHQISLMPAVSLWQLYPADTGIWL